MYRAKDTGTLVSSQHRSINHDGPTARGIPVRSLVQWIKEAELKPRHKLLLRFLADFYAQFRRVCPSIRKLASSCGVSRQALHRWLNELEALGLISRRASYRTNGGRSSNLYFFTIPALQGDVKPQLQERVVKEESVIHEAKPNVASASISKKKNHLRPEDMRKGETAAKHYRIAVENRWISSSENERFGFFTLWGSAVRRYREGSVKNPGSWFTAMLKKDLHLKIGTAEDERTAAKVLNRMRLQSA